MKQLQWQTRAHLMSLFEQRGLHPRGDLGQNFLIDLNILESIVNAADLTPDDVVLEVGAGTGGLTVFLAARGGRVVSVEYDSHMYGFAQDQIAVWDNVQLLNTDALKSKNHLHPLVLEAVQTALDQQRALVTSQGRSADVVQLKLVANLPYQVGTLVMSNLVATGLPWSRMVVTIQWELGQRINAKPGTSAYSALSVWLQSQCKIRVLRKLPPTVFWPRPQVDSAVVQVDLVPELQKQIANREFFQHFLRDVFSHRRKLLRGTLRNLFEPRIDREQLSSILTELQFSETVRAEQLSPPQLVQLSNRLYAALPETAMSETTDPDTETPASEEA